jgi:hypothetical protein
MRRFGALVARETKKIQRFAACKGETTANLLLLEINLSWTSLPFPRDHFHPLNEIEDYEKWQQV